MRDVNGHFLCVAKDERRHGLGLELLNRAVKHATASLLDNQAFNVRITALKSAESFYNKLEMDCQDHSEGKIYIHKGIKGTTIVKKPFYWSFVHSEIGACNPVSFECESYADYKAAQANGWLVRDVRDCQGKTFDPVIPFKQLTEIVTKVLGTSFDTRASDAESYKLLQ